MGGGQGMQGAHPMMHGGILRDAYRVDNLTAEQRKQLDALRDQERQRFQANRTDRDALRDALAKGADAATLRPLAEKEGKHVTEMIMQQAEVRAQVEKILTEPQRAQLKGMAAGQDDSGDRPRGQSRRGGR
jgi:Spy/CpxP family protein refolding chaperone